MFSDEEIGSLISCEKKVTQRPRKPLVPDKNREFILSGKIKCVSTTDAKEFYVFLKQHALLPDQFSIGLMLRIKDGEDINLVRFNCRQFHKNKNTNTEEFHDFHIHRASERELLQGLSKFDAFRTSLYINFNTALTEFCKYCNIRDTNGVILYNDNIATGQVSIFEGGVS